MYVLIFEHIHTVTWRLHTGIRPWYSLHPLFHLLRNKTLLLVVYDDYGGAYDHVIPPAEWRTMDHMGKPRKGKVSL